MKSLRFVDLLYGCRVYSILTGYDAAIRDFDAATSPAVNLADAAHRQALLTWLNRWGCRHVAKSFHPAASVELLDWWNTFGSALPASRTALTALSSPEVAKVAGAYGDLANRKIGMLSAKNRKAPFAIRFRATAAAKILFAVRPQALPPWDDPIRDARGAGDGDADAYKDYVLEAQAAARRLVQEAKARGILEFDIPQKLGRPDSSLAKIIDECNWVYVTRACKRLGSDDLALFQDWSRPISLHA